MSAVERLVPFSGEFQRIALSATVNPLPTAAKVVAGYERHGDTYSERKVGIIKTSDNKSYVLSVCYPEAAASRGVDVEVWDALVPDFVLHINRNTSTLLFVNSRALSEKLPIRSTITQKRPLPMPLMDLYPKTFAQMLKSA